MQINTINSYSIDFGGRRIGGKFTKSYEKTYKVKSPTKEEKYCRQYMKKVQHACDAARGDLAEATDSLNRLEHRFFYNTSNLQLKNVKSEKKTKMI